MQAKRHATGGLAMTECRFVLWPIANQLDLVAVTSATRRTIGIPMDAKRATTTDDGSYSLVFVEVLVGMLAPRSANSR
jgi:hypothetical protein